MMEVQVRIGTKVVETDVVIAEAVTQTLCGGRRVPVVGILPCHQLHHQEYLFRIVGGIRTNLLLQLVMDGEKALQRKDLMQQQLVEEIPDGVRQKRRRLNRLVPIGVRLTPLLILGVL